MWGRACRGEKVEIEGPEFVFEIWQNSQTQSLGSSARCYYRCRHIIQIGLVVRALGYHFRGISRLLVGRGDK